jgi:hypothetical protein
MQLSRTAAVAVAASACLAAIAPAGAALAAADDDRLRTRQEAARYDTMLVKLENANVPIFQARTVHCPSGMRVIGGGAEAHGAGAVLVASHPTEDLRGWVGRGRQDGYDTVGISVYAICAR